MTDKPQATESNIVYVPHGNGYIGMLKHTWDRYGNSELDPTADVEAARRYTEARYVEFHDIFKPEEDDG